jgi:hypothetical protein
VYLSITIDSGMKTTWVDHASEIITRLLKENFDSHFRHVFEERVKAPFILCRKQSPSFSTPRNQDLTCCYTGSRAFYPLGQSSTVMRQMAHFSSVGFWKWNLSIATLKIRMYVDIRNLELNHLLESKISNITTNYEIIKHPYF